jgi:type II secretory pathway pseudopilin PulG
VELELVHDEEGFGLIELVIAMSVTSIALMALVAAMSSGTVAIKRAANITTAATMAETQMEAYRAMTSRDIGLDISSGTVAALDATYKADAACYDSSTAKDCTQAGVSASKALIGPSGTTPDTCTTINGWYTNTRPCTPSRLVSGSTTPVSPDRRSYRVDTYINQIPAAAGTSTSLGSRTTKQVTIVVRDGTVLTKVLARETSIFDCSTGITPNSTDC